MITEEFVTLNTMEWLKQSDWNILAFDFPQSGTGFVLHPDNTTEKNKEAIIPDIAAINQFRSVGLIFENKDRFALEDFNKVYKLKSTNIYNKSLHKLFNNRTPDVIHYGIAMPDIEKEINKAKEHFDKIDFLIVVSNVGKCKIAYSSNKIFNG